jgi:hypothetical protein
MQFLLYLWLLCLDIKSSFSTALSTSIDLIVRLDPGL